MPIPEKTDRRVRKTRTLLRTGLEQLMQKKNIQDITVKELCSVCDINRGTFYAHYSDIYDLLSNVEAQLQAGFETVLEPLTQPTGALGGQKHAEAMVAMFEFMAENAAMCSVLLCKGGDMAFVERLKGIVRDRFFEAWQAIAGDSEQEKSGYTYAFVVSGCIGILQEWMERDMPIPPAEVAAIVQGLLTQGVVGHGQS